jgi:sterol desaturase/sphingolipid hydroxylase (fatty acid hydroxylase superfamily)
MQARQVRQAVQRSALSAPSTQAGGHDALFVPNAHIAGTVAAGVLVCSAVGTLSPALHDLAFAATTFGVLFGSWVIICLSFEAAEWSGLLEKRRLQPLTGRAAAAAPRLKRLAINLALSNWAWLFPAVYVGSPVLQALFPLQQVGPEGGCAMPPAGTLLLQICVAFVLDDICFYSYHRLLHSQPALYIKYHKIHHTFTAPCVWTSHALHPVEIALQSFGALSGPLLVGMSAQMFWLWLAVRQAQGVLDHTGFDFDPFQWLPGVGGTKFHDDHHKLYTGNYASCFSAIDDVLGTRVTH